MIAVQSIQQLAQLPSSFYGNWKVSLEPFRLSTPQREQLFVLGRLLHSFIKACNLFYYHSLREIQPRWIAEYLDLGKPNWLLALGRMNRFQQAIHRIIRPDLVLTEEGDFVAAEFDMIPGGIGLLAQFQQLYGFQNTMLEFFSQVLREESGVQLPSTAIVMTQEAIAYRPEMSTMAIRLQEQGLPSWVVTPEELSYRPDGVFYQDKRLDLLYRFFELYELEHLPNGAALWLAIKRRQVKITPPIKPQLEEKMWFALFHHPRLRPFWITQLGNQGHQILESLIPKTWILDPRPIPPFASLYGLEVQGTPLQEWSQLDSLTQKERARWVAKPSGYSRMSWGAKGVRVGEDLSSSHWQQVLHEALDSFRMGPWILQSWAHPSGQKFHWVGLDGAREELQVRARISPFYFITQGGAQLGGVLATLCSLDKKILHGMPGAILAPCV